VKRTMDPTWKFKRSKFILSFWIEWRSSFLSLRWDCPALHHLWAVPSSFETDLSLRQKFPYFSLRTFHQKPRLMQLQFIDTFTRISDPSVTLLMGSLMGFCTLLSLVLSPRLCHLFAVLCLHFVQPHSR
jgi:hypothetical protein